MAILQLENAIIKSHPIIKVSNRGVISVYVSVQENGDYYRITAYDDSIAVKLWDLQEKDIVDVTGVMSFKIWNNDDGFAAKFFNINITRIDIDSKTYVAEKKKIDVVRHYRLLQLAIENYNDETMVKASLPLDKVQELLATLHQENFPNDAFLLPSTKDTAMKKGPGNVSASLKRRLFEMRELTDDGKKRTNKKHKKAEDLQPEQVPLPSSQELLDDEDEIMMKE